MKILFLDFDGVMIPFFYNKDFDFTTYNRLTDKCFDPKCVEVLNHIIEETGCELVISSDWRLHFTLEELNQILEFNGINKSAIGVTNSIDNNILKVNNISLEYARVSEIMHYIECSTLWTCTQYIAVDDMNLRIKKFTNYIQCTRPNFEGIAQDGIADKIINKLNESTS